MKPLWTEAQKDIISFCAIECRLQASGELSVGHMLEAWACALARPRPSNLPIPHEFILQLGALVEPHKNGAGYRTGYVRVGSNVKIPGRDVPPRMDNLLANHAGRSAADWFHDYENIHPFLDGNGRTGAILYNYLNGTLLQPTWPPNFWSDPRRVSGFGAP